MASKIERGGSGLGAYSPISTLERQYANPGKRLFLFCRANRACCLQGGVESILQMKSVSTATTSLVSTEHLEQQQQQQQPLPPDGVSASADACGVEPASDAGEDPFSFLSEACAGGSGGGGSGSNASSRENSGHQRNNPRNNPITFLKKVAKTTSQSLERGMHTLAIRADQGRNPDLLQIGLYDSASNNVLTLTESRPLLVDDDSSTSAEGSLCFVVPLVIPGHFTQETLTLKLWIRSGAALLQQAKAAKNFLLGSAHVNVGDLRSSLHGGLRASYLTLQLNSAVVVNAKLSLCVTPDLKFPPACGRGWSLADPDIASAYRPTGGGLFNLPLDQSYGFKFPPKPVAYLVATERTTESSLVLPISSAFAKLAVPAVDASMQHAQSVCSILHSRRMDAAVGQYADVNMQVVSIQLKGSAAPTSSHLQAVLSVSWQRPDSILEVELAQPTRTPIGAPPATGEGITPALSFRFFPKACTAGILPSLQQQMQAKGRSMPKLWFGTLRLQVNLKKSPAGSRVGAATSNGGSGITPVNPFDAMASFKQKQQQRSPPSSPTPPESAAPPAEVGDCFISLESLLQQQPESLMDPNKIWEFILQDAQGQPVGTVALTLVVRLQTGPDVPVEAFPARDGLVSLVGLSPLVPSIKPCLDYDADAMPVPTDPEAQRRHSQLLTMGSFISYDYLQQHNSNIREMDAKLIGERSEAYAMSLAATGSASKQQEELPVHKNKSPRPFRPSSSRPEVLLSGIPFNVHTASLTVEVMDPENAAESMGDAFYNTTCGAPADHARGFGNLFKEGGSPVGPVTGGLRRLELKRQEIASTVIRLQTELITTIAGYFAQQRQLGRVTPVTHIPSRHSLVATIQRKIYDAVQCLHHVTWACAVRRASVFSQALGIAATAFMASLSERWQSSWPALWARHGYLISFEGLLSAAGNELGMIEDAYAGIRMLQRVSFVLVRDDGAQSQTRTVVPCSPYIKWIDLSTSGMYDRRQFTLQIGIAQSYYDQRIPASLRNGTPIRIYPLLFEVGVDIRQWGANAGSSVMTQLDRGGGGSNQEKGSVKDACFPAPAGLIDDEDDDVGVRDDDVLVQLNYEAFQLLNSYAHLLSPANSEQTMEAQKTHPLLERLYQHIVSSAGKMNHNILDEAAALAQQLGGGAAVFCKSGKDRTAMHVTFKQAQFAYRFREQNAPAPTDGAVITNTTLQDAAVIRTYGTRLPICEKNVGQAKYAFNSLQVQFMPDALKPPMNTLAGFLKGGKVFTGGGIES